MPGPLLHFMQIAQYVALVLSAFTNDHSPASDYPIGTPQSDAVDHVNPLVFLIFRPSR